jgi:hypothetical protein
MMSKNLKVPASDEAWERGQLGRDEAFVKRAEGDIENVVDEALELQLISIRLQKSLIDDFKYIATLNGIGYQPLMRQVLKRFADCEKKRILKEKADEMRAARANEVKRGVAAPSERASRQRKAA